MLEIKLLNSYRETLDIRHRVLWPSKPKEFCIVEGDEDGIHYGAFLNNQLISVASIYYNNSEVRLRKFATLPEHQEKGYGTLVINHILDTLRDQNNNQGKNATGIKPVVTLGKNATGIKPVVTLGKNATGIKPVVTRFWCDARVTAEGFYKRFGMTKTGNIFLKSGVEYIVMEKFLNLNT